VWTSVVVPEPDWSTAEKTSDLISYDATVVICPKCETEFAAQVVSSPYECTITLNDYPCTSIIADTAFFTQDPDDKWINYDPQEDPYSIFQSSYQLTDKLLEDHGGAGDDLINRMVFAQRITALEAYLADTLINTIKENCGAFSRLLAKDTELAKEKFTLAQ